LKIKMPPLAFPATPLPKKPGKVGCHQSTSSIQQADGRNPELNARLARILLLLLRISYLCTLFISRSLACVITGFTLHKSCDRGLNVRESNHLLFSLIQNRQFFSKIAAWSHGIDRVQDWSLEPCHKAEAETLS